VGREFCKEEEYVMYYQVEELMDTLRHSYDQDNGESFTQKINELESQNLLILDDFGTQKNTDWVLSKLDTIIDCLYINEKNLIVTSNLSLKAMGEISPRIASRLSSGKVVTLVGNDYRTTHKEEGNGK
jgi:DNA replication protein DnaC